MARCTDWHTTLTDQRTHYDGVQVTVPGSGSGSQYPAYIALRSLASDYPPTTPSKPYNPQIHEAKTEWFEINLTRKECLQVIEGLASALRHSE